MQTTLCNRYELGDSKTTKIIIIERLVIVIEAEQVPTSENANIGKFTQFQTFAQIAIMCPQPLSIVLEPYHPFLGLIIHLHLFSIIFIHSRPFLLIFNYLYLLSIVFSFLDCFYSFTTIFTQFRVKPLILSFFFLSFHFFFWLFSLFLCYIQPFSLYFTILTHT